MIRFLVSLILLTAISLSTTAAASAQTAERHFQRGKGLIESNCADCMGSTKKALKEGIADLNKAIDMGYSDKVAAYKLLADAYNTLAIVYSDSGSQEEKTYSEARQDTYRRLLDLDPQNAQIRYEYAMTLSDSTKQIGALRDVLKLNPNYADAHFTIGMLLIRTDQVDEGIGELKKGLQLAEPERSKVFGRRLIDILVGLGRKEEAEQVREDLKKKENNKQ
jgi:tetratricopeptide (TPR) repeat protein